VSNLVTAILEPSAFSAVQELMEGMREAVAFEEGELVEGVRITVIQPESSADACKNRNSDEVLSSTDRRRLKARERQQKRKSPCLK
jgi:hypothetical protein